MVDEEVIIKKDKVRDTEHVSEDVRREEEVDVNETDNRDREFRNRDARGDVDNMEDPDFLDDDRNRR